jgi:hypothetical protein
MNVLDRIKHDVNGTRIARDWLGSGGVTVAPEQSQARANTCLGCDKNKLEWKFEQPVAQAIKKLVSIKNSLQLRVQGEKSLGTCEMCGCDLKTKVHVPLDYILRYTEADELLSLPEKCWVITEKP